MTTKTESETPTPEGTFGLKYDWRLYACTLCGTERRIGTNHTSTCYDDCKGCSWKSDGFGPGMRMSGRIMRLHRYVGDKN